MPAAEPEILYSPRVNATPQTELDSLAAVYRFVLDSHAKKQGRPTTSGPHDAMKGSKHDRATPKYT